MANNTPPERIAVHMFSADLVDIYNADNGQCVNCMRTVEFLFRIMESIDTILAALLEPKGPIGSNRKIEIIRIAAHGNAGILYFPGMYNTRLINARWERLRSYYNPNAQLEIHGCGVASQTDVLKPGANARDPDLSDVVPGTFYGRADGLGLTYLRTVARTFGIPVTAGIDYQFVEANDWQFEHDTVTVYPNGKFRYDSDETRGMTASMIEKQAFSELSRITSQLIDKHKYVDARRHLEQLINNYPGTEAAKRARQRIADNFAPLPPMVPDPF
jgi:hypothetical protein